VTFSSTAPAPDVSEKEKNLLPPLRNVVLSSKATQVLATMATARRFGIVDSDGA